MASAAGTTVNGSGSATVTPYIKPGALGFNIMDLVGAQDYGVEANKFLAH